MLKSTVDKIGNHINKVWVYGCWCCMEKRDKPKHRKKLRTRLKEMLRKEINEAKQG